MSSQLSFFKGSDPARFTWSVSRDKRLKTCLRRYYYQHYASRGGGGAEASEQQRELYVLKWLRNRYMWVGEIVHELVQYALEDFRARAQVDPERLIRRGVQRMRVQYSESLHRRYRERPRLACGLFEHEYDEPISREEWRDARDRMERCLRNFFTLPLVEEIRATPAYQWLALEDASTFIVDGARILVKPDFAWRDEEGRVHLVDWKTGIARPEDERLQLAVYAILGQREWGARSGELVGHAAYLESGEVRDFPIGNEDLAWAEDVIRESVNTMRNLHESEPPAELFPKTEDQDACRMCNFKRQCGR